MNICIEGPRGGQLDNGLQAYATLAVKHFARQLGISRLKTNIIVRIHNRAFVDEIGTDGLCEPINERTFIIDVALFTNWLSTLAHEMVHVKQFARGELDFAFAYWKSTRISENMEYWIQPWEKEARRLQHKLALNFSKEQW